jgi:hypothetical protein
MVGVWAQRDVPYHGDLFSSLEAQLAEDRVHVRLHGGLAQHQVGCDLTIGQAVCRKLGNDPLPRRQGWHGRLEMPWWEPWWCRPTLQCLQEEGGYAWAARRLAEHREPDGSDHLAQGLIGVDESGHADLGCAHNRFSMPPTLADSNAYQPGRRCGPSQRSEHHNDIFDAEVEQYNGRLSRSHAGERLRAGRCMSDDHESSFGGQRGRECVTICANGPDEHDVYHWATPLAGR